MAAGVEHGRLHFGCLAEELVTCAVGVVGMGGMQGGREGGKEVRSVGREGGREVGR